MAFADVEGAGKKAAKPGPALPKQPTMIDQAALDQQYSTVVGDGGYFEDATPRFDPKTGTVQPMPVDDFAAGGKRYPTVPRASFVLAPKGGTTAALIAKIIGARLKGIGPGLADAVPKDYRSTNIEDRRGRPPVLLHQQKMKQMEPMPTPSVPRPVPMPVPTPGSQLADVIRRAAR